MGNCSNMHITMKVWIILVKPRMGGERDWWWILNIALGPVAEAVTVSFAKAVYFFFKGKYTWPYLEYLDSLRGRTRLGQSPIISVVAGAIPTSGQIAEALAFPDISHTLIVWLSKCSVGRSLINEKKKKKELAHKLVAFSSLWRLFWDAGNPLPYLKIPSMTEWSAIFSCDPKFDWDTNFYFLFPFSASLSFFLHSVSFGIAHPKQAECVSLVSQHVF